MVVLKLNRKIYFIVFIFVLLIFAGLITSSNIAKSDLQKKYDSLMCIANQFDKTKAIPFIASLSPYENKNIEVFDVSKGKVIKRTNVTPAIREEITDDLKNITGLYVKIKALPENGYIVKIPVNPSESITTNQWLNDSGITKISEVFVILPAEEKPYLLLLDSKSRPFFYNYTGNNENLLNHIKINETGDMPIS